MAKYRVETEDGKAYEVETEDGATSTPTATAPKPALYGHTGYQSKMPSFLGRMDNAVSDSVNAMAEGAQKLFGSGKTVDERLGGASQMGRGFVNSAGAPMLARGLVAAPLKTALGVGTGLVGQKAGSTVAQIAGAGPGTQDFVGDATGLATGIAASQVPGSRLGSAAKAGTKAAVKATPILGKGAKAAVEDWRKSAPGYVDPKIAQAEARLETAATAKANVKAKGQAKVKTDAEIKAAADKERLTQTRAELAARGKGSDAPQESDVAWQPPQPEVVPIPPADGRSPGTNRLYGHRSLPPPKPPPPPTLSERIDAIPEQGPQIPAQPPLPTVTPTPPVDGKSFGGRLYGPREQQPLTPSAPPSRTPLWQRSAPVPNAPIEMTPQQQPTPRAPRVVRDAPQPAPPAVAPAVTQQPQAVAPQPTTPPVAANSGPSAPEGSAVIPPVAGRPNRYGDMGGKLGEQVARDAHLKDTAVAKYLNEQKVTQGQFRAADPAQKARWAREANPKYKGYTDPDRIDDLANLLQPDAPAGPTLYQGKQ